MALAVVYQKLKESDCNFWNLFGGIYFFGKTIALCASSLGDDCGFVNSKGSRSSQQRLTCFGWCHRHFVVAGPVSGT